MTSSLHLIQNYTALVYTQTESSFTRAARFFLRALFLRRATLQWLAFIEATPALRQAPDFVRRVLCDKIHRPFSRRALTTQQRVDLLITHYDLMAKAFPEEVVREMVAGKRFLLAQTTSMDGKEPYNITLSREMLSQHQGELTLLFRDPTYGLDLARLPINLVLDKEGRKILVLNGIQGPGPEYKDRIVRVTRNLAGLRPKRAILEVACALAQWLQFDAVIAIGKRNHVSQSKKKWQVKNRSDYDSFWEEITPEPRADGDYDIPPSIPRKNIEEVPSKKKKLTITRYALMDKITADAILALDKLGRG